MNKIKKLKISHLRNEEWFKFMSEIIKLIKDDNASYGSTSPEIGELVALQTKADLVLKQMRKSFTTAELEQLDADREKIYSGMKLLISGMTYHDQKSKVDAAHNLLDVFKNYGDITRQTYDEETGTIYNLVEDLKHKYTNEVSELNLSEWVERLKNANDSFDEKIRTRDVESGTKPEFTMLEIRQEATPKYEVIMDKLYASALLHTDEDTYQTVINNINAAIDRFKVMLSHRKSTGESSHTPEFPADPNLPQLPDLQ
jgi:hypothetical protein